MVLRSLLLLLLSQSLVETLRQASHLASALPNESLRRGHAGRLPPLRLRGGGAFEEGFVTQNVKFQHDIEYDSEGWYRHGDYLFRSLDQANRLVEEPFCVKVAGSVISPFNWHTMLKSLAAGRPQRTVGMRRIRRDESVGPLVMIDGADDIATALQGSGVPQQLRFAMQAFVLYPLVLPIVEFGFRGAEGDHIENRAEAAEARDEVLLHKTAFIQDAAALERDLSAVTNEAASDLDLPSLHAASSPAASERNSSWSHVVRWMVSAQGSKLPREWRDHVEDEQFLAHGRAAIRRLAALNASAEHKAQVEHLVRRLAVLEGVVRKAWEPRLRANLTSPLAMFACAGMWWAMLLHELAAIGGFWGGRRWQAVGRAARGLADWILPMSQGFMALYGASVGVAGVREASELNQNLQRVEGSPSLQGFGALKAALRYTLEALRASNAMAEIVAGPALFFGQALMALGGPSMLANLWVLAAGSVLTAFSIVIKIFVDLDTERRFGYNDDALSVASILLDDVPPTLPSCPEQYELRALEIIQQKRVVYLRELAWIKVLSLLHQTATPPSAGLTGFLRSCLRRCLWSVPSSSGGMRELLAGIHGTYRERYDTELHGMLQAIVADREVEAVLQRALPLAGDALFVSFLFFSVLDAIRPPPASVSSGDAGDKGAVVDEQQQVKQVAGLLRSAVDRWSQRDRAANLEEVLEKLEQHELSPQLQEAVLDYIMVKGSWSKQVDRWHRPFIEVVDCWEERTFKVPGLLRLLHLWTVKHVKQAYRFLPGAFLGLYRDAQAEGAVHPRHMAAGVSSIKQVADKIATATWRVVEVHRKFRDRSELGCLNEALLELLRQRELRTSLVTTKTPRLTPPVGASLEADASALPAPPGATSLRETRQEEAIATVE